MQDRNFRKRIKKKNSPATNSLLRFFQKRIARLVGVPVEMIDCEVLHDLREKQDAARRKKPENLQKENEEFLSQFGGKNERD